MNTLIGGIQRWNNRFQTNSVTSFLCFFLFRFSSHRRSAFLSHRILIQIAKRRRNDNLTFAVGLLLYTRNQHALANSLFKKIANYGCLTPRMLHMIALSASWERDFEILERIALEANGVKSIVSFVKGLITHVSLPKESIKYFSQVHDLYLVENAQNSTVVEFPEYVKLSMNVSSYDHVWNAESTGEGLLYQKEVHRLNAKIPNSKVSKMVLMSYTSEYLFSLAEIVITRIRTKHGHAIFLVIAIPDNSTVVDIQEFCNQLSSKFGNIYWQIISSHFNLPTFSGIVRYIFAKELFRGNICESILIIDADTSFVKVDPIDVWEGIREEFDIAVLANESLCPWERISVGFTILNNTDMAMEFLSGFDAYVTQHFRDKKAYWMLDQTAAYMVLSELRKGEQVRPLNKINALDLSRSVSLMDFIFTDDLIIKRKLQAKATNPEFRAGMAEPLYYD